MMFYLPSELEWEYAASGGPNNDHYIYSGSDDVNSVAWYKGNSNDLTHEVGSKYPNSLGIYDMSGNVREWCDGWDGSKRALRGGGWYNDAESNSITARYSDKPQIRDNNYGFRICLEL
jgi:formylglycine-generating enzyme required for sulfatase activity